MTGEGSFNALATGNPVFGAKTRIISIGSGFRAPKKGVEGFIAPKFVGMLLLLLGKTFFFFQIPT